MGRLRSLAFATVQSRVRDLGREPVDDTQNRRHGESISAFIKTASALPVFVVILSQRYLESEYCMDELLHIWRECKSDSSIFRDRVRPICLRDIDLKPLANRDKVRKYWRDREVDVTATIQGVIDAGDPVPSEYNDTRQLALALINESPAILSCIADMVYIRDLAELDRLTF
jgi:internalin A